MSRKFKVIGLALVAICAFGAISAAAAQATPQWTVGGKAISSSVKIATTAKLTKVNPEESVASSTLTVPTLGINLTCTGLNVEGGVIEPTKTGSATSLSFTSCIVASAPVACQVKNAGGTVGTINTNGLKAELVTNTFGTFAKFKPTGTNFVEIVIEKTTGHTCSVSGNYPVTGEAALQVQTGTSATYLEGTANKEVQEHAGVKLLFGEKESFLDATGDLALENDSNWGVDA